MHGNYCTMVWSRGQNSKYHLCATEVFRLLVHEPLKKKWHMHRSMACGNELCTWGISLLLGVCWSDCVLVYRQDDYAVWTPKTRTVHSLISVLHQNLNLDPGQATWKLQYILASQPRPHAVFPVVHPAALNYEQTWTKHVPLCFNSLLRD